MKTLKHENIKTIEHCYLYAYQQGMAALFTVVVIAAAALIMAYSASLLGLGELDMGYTSQRGAETFAVADGCMEESLRQVKLDASYSGGTLNLGGGTCIIVVDIIGNNGTSTVTSTVDQYNKKIQTTFILSGNVITVDSWKELSS